MNKILIVTPYFRPAQSGGGGQVSIENLSDLLAGENNVTVVCYNHDFNSAKKLINETKRRINLTDIFYFSFKSPFQTLKAINEVNFDFIYINSFFSPICIFFQFYFYFSKSMRIISPKGEFYDAAFRSKPVKKRLLLLVHRLFFLKNRFHATSHHEVPIIGKYFPGSNIEVARDIPSAPRMNLEMNAKRENDTFKVVYCSRIDQKKNLIFIADIFQNVTCKLSIDIWGEVYDQPYFDQAIKKFSILSENINWSYKGKLNFEESKIIFSGYDLFFFPTRGENYGHVIYESLSCGCPVLLSKDTTPWNDLEENDVGFNIELNKKEEWVEKIRYYHDLTILEREKIFSLCRSYAANKFDIISIKDENKKLFSKK